MSELPQSALTLQLTNDDPCNTSIFDVTHRKILYVVETQRASTSAKSSIKVTTDVYNGEKTLIASLRWKDLVSDEVTLPSKSLVEKPLSRWLKKGINPFKITATFSDSNGSTFKWDTKGLHSQFRLLALDGSRDTPIAYFERAQPYGTLEKPDATPSMLHLTAEADVIRDDVVLSFLFMEKERRREAYITEKFSERQVASAGGQT